MPKNHPKIYPKPLNGDYGNKHRDLALLKTWPRYWQKGRVKRCQNSLQVYPRLNITDLCTRLWGINTEFARFISQSLVLRYIMLDWISIYRNWSIKLEESSWCEELFKKPWTLWYDSDRSVVYWTITTENSGRATNLKTTNKITLANCIFPCYTLILRKFSVFAIF